MIKMLGPTSEQAAVSSSRDFVLTPSQAARILGISRQAVWNAINRGHIRSVGSGRDVRVSLSDVVAYGIKQGIPGDILLRKAKRELEQEVDWATVAKFALLALGAWALVRLIQRENVPVDTPVNAFSK